MKKTCGTVVFREYDLDKTLDAIYNAGYRYFETQATNPWCNHVVLDRDDPVVFAKKAKSINLDNMNYHTQVQSFTHKKVYEVIKKL